MSTRRFALLFIPMALIGVMSAPALAQSSAWVQQFGPS